MILNLLRVEQLRVEDMIRRSFSEFHAQRNVGSHRQAMENLKGRIAEVKDIECYLCSCLLYTSPSPRDEESSRMPSSA